jgi:hypothetical protein
MPLHPLAAGFASVADAYERGRPEYPLGAVGALGAELTLAPGARVLDLAAGTGKLSRALLAVGWPCSRWCPIWSGASWSDEPGDA